MRLYFTSGYHSKEDGQIKYNNQTLEQYLCIYCNYQYDNWSDLFLLTKFVYNNAPSAITGISLFFTNKDYHLNITIHLARNITLYCIHEFAVDLNKLQNTLEMEISPIQQ